MDELTSVFIQEGREQLQAMEDGLLELEQNPDKHCEQRAFPSLKHPLTVLEDVRGVSLYAPVSEGRRG